MEILGLIPARGGSKGISKKNIALLKGKPLLAYTCEAAQESQCLTRILLNTDDPEIAAIGRHCGIETPFMRPSELAQDDTPILPVIQHTLEWLEHNDGFLPEAVVLLQPTSPFRRSEHIDKAIQLLLERNADTVVSVVAVPHQFNPVSVMSLGDDGYLTPFLADSLILRRQNKPIVYARNGPAVLVVRREVIEQGKIYNDKVLPLYMDRSVSLDIDDLEDLRLAEFWMAWENRNKQS